MQRTIASVVYLISGILIALGGAGHSFGAVAQIHEAFARSAIDPQIARLIVAVWHFAGAAMLALGLLVLRGWWVARRGQILDPAVPVVVGVFYVGYGAAALAWMKEPFWAIFIVYGFLAFASGLTLRKS